MSPVRLIAFIALASGFALGGCGGGVQTAPTTVQQGQAQQFADLQSSYILGSGDKIRLIVYGEDQLSGEFTVDDAGQLSLPLVGAVSARGLSIPELTDRIKTRFQDGYLRDPKLGLEILRYRPFYISGEVDESGEYPYVVGLTVPQAIATAGGYSRRANKAKVTIIRAKDGTRYSYPADQTTRVFPGDVIEVPERYF